VLSCSFWCECCLIAEILGLWGLIVGAKVGVFGADFGELGFWSGYLNGGGCVLGLA
jgi:hypothetical protein